LPISRSIQTGGTATFFGTIINIGSDTATGCGIATMTTLPITSLFQTTNPNTNALTGLPNQPANNLPRQAPSLPSPPTANRAFGPVDIALNFFCSNRASAISTPGLDTVLVSASNTPTPDIIALGATPTNDGISNIPGNTGTGLLAVATSNIGASGLITVTADTG